MQTPICDFVRDYISRQALRLHMPGHKGQLRLGMEDRDITEIDGADSLYEASGIIAKSEENAASLFGCPTYYSTEGSSQCIRAMVYLAYVYARSQGHPARIAAARNVHKTFLSAAALLDVTVDWLCPKEPDSYLSCRLSALVVEDYLASCETPPAAVYLTSPDYLGNVADIAAIAQVCRRYGVLLLVDNAHGAYLRFLPESHHPMDLGADLCCDSAHKTLPVLTGGAYLHISPRIPGNLTDLAKQALALFGSTSPSYLILQSLDGANEYLETEFPQALAAFLPLVQALKDDLIGHGFFLHGEEPLKITLRTKPYGYTGQELADILYQSDIVCEFADPDYLVMMLTPEIGFSGLDRIQQALLAIPPRTPIPENTPVFRLPQPVMSLREAMLAMSEEIPIRESIGRILAAPSVGCPPAVPIVICGERIEEADAACFQYYGITTCRVVR